MLHPLATTLLQLRLPLALTSGSTRSTFALSRASTHTRQTLPRARESGESQVSRVDRDRSPSVPRLVSNQRGKNHAEPSPVGDIPHPFRQALGLKVLAGALQVAIGVGWAANSFEPELDDESWEVEDEPGEDTA